MFRGNSGCQGDGVRSVCGLLRKLRCRIPTAHRQREVRRWTLLRASLRSLREGWRPRGEVLVARREDTGLLDLAGPSQRARLRRHERRSRQGVRAPAVMDDRQRPDREGARSSASLRQPRMRTPGSSIHRRSAREPPGLRREGSSAHERPQWVQQSGGEALARCGRGRAVSICERRHDQRARRRARHRRASGARARDRTVVSKRRRAYRARRTSQTGSHGSAR